MSTQKRGTTKHFKNCLGIFQGGGCKALAFVGAYREAYDRGVFFSQVAGTSAGSIIAALIAAGADPAYLEGAIEKTDFTAFLRPPDKSISGGNHPFAAAASPFGSKKFRQMVIFLRRLGLYSSAEIESWLEAHLRRLLPKARGAFITFADLNIPLHVVATEVGATRPVIWNADETPDSSVAHAVRCSCTIPFFFQPVRGRFVDGGVVSNLPAFAISRSNRGAFEKLLCFTFATAAGETQEDLTTQDPESYLRKLVSSIIDGAVTVQSLLQEDLHVIEMESLPLDTVDFDKINKESIEAMFKSGANAASRFFNSEATRLHPDGNTRPILLSEPQTLNQIVREDAAENDQIWISLAKTRYVYNLFPSFLHWRTRGSDIRIITRDIASSAKSASDLRHEHFRRLVLKCLGVRLVEVASLPFEGFFFQRDGKLGNAVVLDENRDDEKLANFAVKYDRQQDAAAIQSMLASLRCLFGNEIPRNAKPEIEFVAGGLDSLVSRLKALDQYKPKDVVIDFEEVDVDRIVFLTKYVKSYKYGQISRIFDIYRQHSLQLFESAQIRYTLEGRSVAMPITPPVAEEHDGRLFLLDGNSRLTYLIKEERARRVGMLVVKNVSARLPATGMFSASQLRVSDEGKVGSDRYDGWSRSDYRPIEEAARNPDLYKSADL